MGGQGVGADQKGVIGKRKEDDRGMVSMCSKQLRIAWSSAEYEDAMLRGRYATVVSLITNSFAVFGTIRLGFRQNGLARLQERLMITEI